MTRRQFGIPELLVAITLIAVFAMSVRVPYSPDMWWHLRCGEVQWQSRSVLKSDLFSHTAIGTPWVNQSWLPQLAMYALYTVGGFPALALAVALLTTIAFAFVLLSMRTVGRYDHFGRALIIIWAAISTGRTWVPRPQMITFVLTAAWALILDQHRRRSPEHFGPLVLLPPVMILWANSHGGYIVGFILLALQIAGVTSSAVLERTQKSLWPSLRPLLIVTGLCFLAAMINPQGIRLVLFPFQTLNSGAQQNLIAEWASPDFHALDMLPFLALLISTWSALAFSEQAILGEDWFRLTAFTVIGLRSGRYIGLSAIVMAPLLFKYGASAWTRLRTNWRKQPITARPARGIPALNWVLLVLILFAAGIKVALPLNAQTIAQVHRDLFPVNAVEFLRDQEPQGNLFNEYGWGGYLIWALYPDSRVFIDGRADPFGDDLIVDYRRVLSAQPGWAAVLDRYRVHTALIRTSSALASALHQNDDWQIAYQDHLATVFVHRTDD